MTEQNNIQRGDSNMRMAMAAALGHTLGKNDRNVYDVFNWNQDPTVEEYYTQFLRNPYARAITEIPVNTTWRDPPEIKDEADQDDPTQFEEAIEELEKEQRIWHYAKRADTLAGIGEYGLLVLEFDDISSPADFDTEVTSANELTGLRPFSQASVEEIEVGGPASGRWDEPVRYQLDLSDEDDNVDSRGPDTLWVHHSRVIHIPSDGLLDDEIRGTPRQEPVYNVLTDIEKTLGSSAEVAYRASAWGLNINLDPEYQFKDEDKLSEDVERWQYGLENVLKTKGADRVESLGGEELHPKNIIDPQIEALSAQTGIPQSVLKGNESGERATTEDLYEWYGKMGERREEFATPAIVREIIDRILEVGVTPDPVGEGYVAEWNPLHETSEDDIAEIEKKRAEVINTATWVSDAMDVDQQREYIEEGEWPDELEEPEEEPLDESDPAVQEQFEQMQGGSEQPAVADGGEEE